MPNAATDVTEIAHFRLPLPSRSRQRQRDTRMRARYTLHRQRAPDDGHHRAVQGQPLAAARVGCLRRVQAHAVVFDGDFQPTVS